MSQSISLNGTWELTWGEGINPINFCGTEISGHCLLPARVPAPVHHVLMDAGLVQDPNVGANALAARWVEEQHWVYRRSFEVPPEALQGFAWLSFEQLDLMAKVHLNGELLGEHSNAHRPAVFSVGGKLKAGENLLVVVVEAGLIAVADKPGAEYGSNLNNALVKSRWLRKAPYQFGWDWNPRLVSVGITGDVSLRWGSGPRLMQTTVFSLLDDDLGGADLFVRASIDNPGAGTVEAVLRASLPEAGIDQEITVNVPPGESRHELRLRLEKPRLWWPRGHGEQHLYGVELRMECGGEMQIAVRRTGIRKVAIDQSPHPVEGRYFILKVNDRPVFCKGGNWVPPEMLPSTVTPDKERRLVQLAVEANFNTLRIWGGAVFADEALCDACDEAGILLWHDFLFACDKYPGDEPEFVAEIRRETTWAVREMAHHPCLAVWCGNNEVEWLRDHHASQYRAYPHYYLFHREIPAIVRNEDPSRPYWPSSPFSPDYLEPNDPTAGDQHPWKVSIQEPGGAADFWTYRSYIDRFPNEGGVLGTSSPATLRRFLPEKERHISSFCWDYHDNPFSRIGPDPCLPGRTYRTVQLWTGLDPLGMEMDDYAFISGLLHSEGLREYIANYRRRMFSSASAIFWMYNDSWPVTHGWTIVDYYERRKPAYHPVRRAFSPVTVVVAEEDGLITVYGVNDTPHDWTGEVRWGIFLTEGGSTADNRQEAFLPANASTPLASFDRSEMDRLGLDGCGAFALLYQDGHPAAQHRLLLERFGNLKLTEPAIAVHREPGRIVLSAESFVWGVCLDPDGETPLTDDLFDLLPGIGYELAWDDEKPLPVPARTGNGLLAKFKVMPV